jgi:hypothetical protein
MFGKSILIASPPLPRETGSSASFHWIMDFMLCPCSEAGAYSPRFGLAQKSAQASLTTHLLRKVEFCAIPVNVAFIVSRHQEGPPLFSSNAVSHLAAIERVGCYIAHCQMTMASTNDCDHRTDCRPPHPRPPIHGRTLFRSNVGSHHTWRRRLTRKSSWIERVRAE